ncbi:MAG: OmpA family protein [Myxococcota bacterium]
MRTMLRRLVTVVVVAGLAAQAGAAEPQNFTVERFRPVLDPEGLASVDTAEIPGHLEFNVGAHGNYARNVLLQSRSGTGTLALVGHRLGAEAGVQLGLFNHVALGVYAPGTLLQLRTDTSLMPLGDTLRELFPAGPGDVRLSTKARLLRQDLHFVSVAVSADVTVPTSLGLAYLGEPAPTFTPQIAVSRSIWGLRMLGNASLKLRGERFIGQQSFSDEATLRAGLGYDVSYHLKNVRLMPFVELVATTGLVTPLGLGASLDTAGLRSVRAQNTLEWGGGLKFEPLPGLQWVTGLSVGVLPGVGNPDWRVYSGLRFGFRVRDVDHDGVPDVDDRCKLVPEDRDGFSDADGCPELDNDVDNVPDTRDLCPDLAEDRDEFSDDDGCPEADNDWDGVLDPRDACPNQAGVVDNKGCPETDVDNDGVPDADDRCREEPEDGDHFNDEDGCPEPDNDEDGLLDNADACPVDAEDKDAFKDEDGCPDVDNDEDGVADPLDACPLEAAPPERAAQGEGCPDRDTDVDGILDSADACPADAEDKDGYEDGDGCPEADNDKDGVPDTLEKCPLEPETINGVQDEDGCPDEGPKPLVKVTEQKLEILEKVYFDTAKAKIQKRSFNLLNQVALTIKANPQIKLVAVEGHTDSQGKREKNVVLSQQRADAVRNYLIKQGVEPERLKAVGFGPDRPVGDNKTANGREANRRVEFVIVEKQ